VQQRAETLRVIVPGDFEKLLKVDDLVIAPVADVAPGVLRVFDLPVDAFLGFR
jgi:hypothetical protein